MKTLQLYLGILRDAIKSFGKLFVFHKLTLQEVRDEGENIKTFIFESNRKLDYKAGQYGIWFMPKFIKGKPGRLFTLASSPEEGIVQLSTRIGKTDFKQKLSRLKPGATVFMEGPIGQFTLPNPSPEAVVFIAGGIGITPIRALAVYVHDAELPVNTTLIHSADDFYLYKDEMKQYFHESHFVTRSDFETVLRQVAHDQANATFFLSGPPGFVESAHTILRKQGIKRIKTDAFLGY
ncbi:MAG TPA: FAD-dependent oxidoreductase [Candidatus Limnocylindrales bacterium]|nr:FAD-dependent oxidoreductase [Candidatus Limnocylindrales bacterium]